MEEREDIYVLDKLPHNVRQVGIPMPGRKLYMEDYVVTCLKQSFLEMEESQILVLLGKQGQEEAKDALFVYGAIKISGELTDENWEEVKSEAEHYFQGAEVMRWSYGVSMWNSEADQKIRQVHRKYFDQEDSLLFLEQQSEEEEKLYRWRQGALQEQTGYFIYYAKNPYMQEYMLRNQDRQHESIDEGYDDQVTSSMRRVFDDKEEEKQHRSQMITAGIGLVAAFAVVIGANTMLISTKKINTMEKTVNALSEYVNQKQMEVSALEQKAQDTVAQVEANQDSKTESANKGDSKSVSANTENSKKQSQTKVNIASEEKDTSENTTKNNTKVSKLVDEKSENSSVQKKKSISASDIQEKGLNDSYIVQQGDTLSQIVWRQYHDYNKIKSVKKKNHLSDADTIYCGQCLILPRY